MMLRSNDRYFDFKEDIDVEKQSKLLEAIADTAGDFSYQFDLKRTDNNMSIFGFPTADVVKSIYRSVPCDILGDDNIPMYSGQIRVENLTKTEISCSFFSGNYNWINQLSGDMTDLDLSAYTTDLTKLNIIASFANDSGIVFPFIDLGGLVTRSYRSLKTEDFVGSFYVKTLMHEVFAQSGLKLQGDLLSDPMFNKLVIVTNTRSKVAQDNNSIFVATEISQSGNAGPFAFELQTDPYYVGSDITVTVAGNVLSGNRFLFPNGAILDIEIEAESDDVLFVNVEKNGSTLLIGGVAVGVGGNGNFKGTTSARLDAGDRLSFSSTAAPGANLLRMKVKVKPVFIYQSTGRGAVPLWTMAQFVNNFMQLFCCISDYDAVSKTVTIDLLDKLKSKDPIEITESVEITDTNFSELVDNYGQKTNIEYSSSNDEDLSEYNISTYVKYGAGVISIANDFIPKSKTLFTSDISSPISYINLAFACSLEKINFVQIANAKKSTNAMQITSDITSVTIGGSGEARLNIANANRTFQLNDLVRIDFDGVYADGEYVVDDVTSTYITLFGLPFASTTTGQATKLRHELTSDDSVYIFAHTPGLPLTDISGFSTFMLDDSSLTDLYCDYFNLLKTGAPIEDTQKQGLSFGQVTNPSSFQRNIIQTYWNQFSLIANDPEKLFLKIEIPKHTFLGLTPLRPIRVRTLETDNLYYLNRVSGYKNSYTPCTLELIKLS